MIFIRKIQSLVERNNERKINDVLRSEVYEEMAKLVGSVYLRQRYKQEGK